MPLSAVSVSVVGDCGAPDFCIQARTVAEAVTVATWCGRSDHLVRTKILHTAPSPALLQQQHHVCLIALGRTGWLQQLSAPGDPPWVSPAGRSVRHCYSSGPWSPISPERVNGHRVIDACGKWTSQLRYSWPDGSRRAHCGPSLLGRAPLQAAKRASLRLAWPVPGQGWGHRPVRRPADR